MVYMDAHNFQVRPVGHELSAENIVNGPLDTEML